MMHRYKKKQNKNLSSYFVIGQVLSAMNQIMASSKVQTFHSRSYVLVAHVLIGSLILCSDWFSAIMKFDLR